LKILHLSEALTSVRRPPISLLKILRALRGLAVYLFHSPLMRAALLFATIQRLDQNVSILGYGAQQRASAVQAPRPACFGDHPTAKQAA
jgi:hypothetical protein